MEQDDILSGISVIPEKATANVMIPAIIFFDFLIKPAFFIIIFLCTCDAL